MIAAALALSLRSEAAGQWFPTRLVADPVADALSELPRERESYVESDTILYRVVRDYDNDGRADVALALAELCGNGSFSTGCMFEVYLARAEGDWIDAGALYGSIELQELESVRPGETRLNACRANREGELWIDPIRINQRGFVEEPAIPLTEAEYDARCLASPEDPPPAFFRETCSVRDFLRAGACVWAREQH